MPIPDWQYEAIIGKLKALTQWQAHRIRELEKETKMQRIKNWVWAKLVPLTYEIRRLLP